jgi:iron complex outermembrane receptor protein
VPPTAAALCATRNITAANFFTNAVDTRTEGIEVVATYAMELVGGTLNASIAYSSADTDIEDVNDPSVDGVVILGVEEGNTIEGAAPEDKGVGTLTWRNDRVSALTRLSYYGETTRIFNFGGGFEPEQTYGSEWQLDAEVSVQVVDTVELFVGGTNLADEYPDKSSSDINYFGNLPYDVLSPLGFQGRYVYGGARIAL